jgi:hypothetical protein
MCHLSRALAAVLALVTFVAWCEPAVGQGQPPRRGKKEKERMELSIDGAIENIRRDGLVVKNGGKDWLIQALPPSRKRGPDGQPLDFPGTQVEVTGTANVDFLQPNLIVSFRAEIDGKTLLGKEPLRELKLVTPGDQVRLGVAPDGGGLAAAPDKKGKKPASPIEGMCTVTLPVKTYGGGKLSFTLAGKKQLTFEVAEGAKIDVDWTGPKSLQFVRKGDQLEAQGYYLQEGLLYAEKITVKLATPLSGVAKPAR